MNKGFDQERTDRLMNEAFEALDEGEPEAALRIAKKLRGLKYSGCFEVQALAYADLGKRTKAIKVLREGTDKCPDIWMLWQLLGNNLSDEGRLDEAFDAYENGLSTEESDRRSLSVNYAIALMRSGETKQARERIRPILEAPDFQELTGSLRARLLTVELEALRILDQSDAAAARFEAIGDGDFGEDAGAELSMLWGEYARSLLELGRRSEAEKAAVRSASFNLRDEEALWFLREVRREPSDTEVISYRLMVEGDWAEPLSDNEKPPAGFFSSYWVCAESEREALAFVEELQADEVSNLRISESEMLQKCKEPKGIYSGGGYTFYDRKENEN